jgi:hypothetical protein
MTDVGAVRAVAPSDSIRRAAARPPRGSAPFVWGAWAVMLLVATASVAVYGRDIPFAEDWLLVAPLTGNEPHLVRWAWTPNSEHLVPIPKLLLLLLLKLSGGDFRVGMFFDTLLLAAVGGGAILVAGRLRGGHVRATDAFFPIALLHLGHWDNLLWSWQIQFVLSTALTVALLLLVVSWREGPPTPAGAAAAGACVTSLALSGGNGVVVAPAFAVWLLYCGVLRWRDERPRSGVSVTGALAIGSAAAVLALVAAYLLGYERPSWNPASPSPGATARTSLKFVAFGFGPAARDAWLVTSAAALGVLALAGRALLGGLASAWPTDRRRLLGLALLAGALVALALAMGWGRAGRVESSGRMSTRYALLAVPALCAAYFTAELYGSRGVRRLTQGALLVAAIGLLPMNTLVGVQRRNWFERGMESVESDVRAGVPVDALADRHYRFLLPWSRDDLAAGIRMLREDCVGPLAQVQDGRATVHEVGCPGAVSTTSRR